MTWTASPYQPLAGTCGTLAVVVGAVRSILIPSTVAVVTLPATSLIDALAPRFSPSPATVLSVGQLPSMPEPASEQVQATVTSPAYQPLALGLVVTLPVSVGGVLSSFSVMLLPVLSSTFPAWSVLQKVTVCVPLVPMETASL